MERKERYYNDHNEKESIDNEKQNQKNQYGGIHNQKGKLKIKEIYHWKGKRESR